MRKVLSSAGAPKAIGPYSQAIEAPGARTLWLSGQIPLDPATGELVQGDIDVQTERVMENLARGARRGRRRVPPRGEDAPSTSPTWRTSPR